jgi:hypothetical protein
VAACKGQITKRTQFFRGNTQVQVTMNKLVESVFGAARIWVHLASFLGPPVATNPTQRLLFATGRWRIRPLWFASPGVRWDACSPCREWPGGGR